jgi:PAS domain S-box-containing protein
LFGTRTAQLGGKAKNEKDAMGATEIKFRALIEHSSDGILLLDRNHRVMFSSTAVQRILGYPTSEIIGQKFAELIHPEERAATIRRWRQCLPGCTGCTDSRLTRVRHLSGQWRELDCVYSNLLHEPLVRGIVINFRDVTESSLAAEALRKSEEKFSKAFRSSPLAISISTKAEGLYLDVNDAFLRTFGYARAEIIGQCSVELGIWAEPDQRKALIRELEHRSLVMGVRATFKTKKGDLRDAEIAAEPIDLGGTSCVLAITQDVTETRHLEAQLRHAQKMEAVGRLAGGVAHDFNNFLMVMRSYAQLIEVQSLDPSIKEHSKRIVDAADRAANISRQLLAFSRKQPQQLQKLDLNRTVSDFCKLLPGFIGEDVKLRVSVAAEPAIVLADQGQVEQVIMNLAVNARDAMPSGGQLAVEVSQV